MTEVFFEAKRKFYYLEIFKLKINSLLNNED